MIKQNTLATGWSRSKRSVIGAIALGAALVVLPGCNTAPSDEEISEGQTNVTTEDIAAQDLGTEGVEGTGLEDVESLIGQTVTVRSTVDATVGESGLTLATDSEPILVINATTAPFTTPAADVPVQVTGEVAQFVLADVESEYGLDLDEGVFSEYETQPVIIAESLALAPSPEDIAEDPAAFDNQVIALEGDVREIVSDSTFTLFQEGWIDDYGILVIGVNENLQAENFPLQEGETVVVTGTTRPFDADALQQEYGLELSEEQLSAFSEGYNRPVLIADDIYPSAVDE